MFDLFFPRHWSTLKKLIWLKAAALSSAVQKTISGAILSIKDALAMPAQSLVVAIAPVQSGSGDPSPDNVRPITGWTGCSIQHCGKNLFNVGSTDNAPGYYYSDSGVKTYDGVSLSSGLIRCKPNTVYTVQNIANAGSASNTRMFAYDANKNFISIIAKKNAPQYQLTSVSGTTPANAAYLRISGYLGPVGSAGNGTKCMLAEAEESSTYEAYTGQTYSITFPPLNLFNKNDFDSVAGHISNGKISLAGGRVTVYVPCKPNTKYTAQKIRQVANDRFTLGWTKELPANNVDVYGSVAASNSGTVGTKTSLTITTGADAQYLVCWFTWSASNAEVYAAEKDTFMIEEYSLALEYVPYGNGPVYNGSLNVTTGELTIKTARRVLTGQETFGIWAAANPHIITCNGFLVGCMNPAGSGIPFANIVMLNSHYKHATNGSVAQNPKNTVYYYGERLCIITDPDDSYTTETFATYAAAQYAADTPITCVYQLATPIKLTFTPQEVTLLLGENTLWADTGDLEMTYMADGTADDVQALNILLGGRYVNNGGADEATDAEALNILLGR